MVDINKEHISDSVIENLFMIYHLKTEDSVCTSEKYKEKISVSSVLEESHREKLSKDDEREFDELLRCINDNSFEMGKGFFKEGFIQGVNLILEIQSSNKSKEK